MISDKDLLHGAALHELIVRGTCKRITLVDSSGVFLLEALSASCIAMLKYSTKPKSPWQFSFSLGDDELLGRLESKAHKSPLQLGMICNRDGVCALPVSELPEIGLRIGGLSGQSISVARPGRGSYRVSGPGRTRYNRTISKRGWSLILTEGG